MQGISFLRIYGNQANFKAAIPCRTLRSQISTHLNGDFAVLRLLRGEEGGIPADTPACYRDGMPASDRSGPGG